ncbi:MAG: flagellar brake protein [Colwellia sp.]
MADQPTQVEMTSRLNRNLGLFHAGSMVTIEIVTPAGQKGKFRTVFIGYLSKQYVLIQYPDPKKIGGFSQYITQGTAVTVRGLIEGHEGSVVAFATTIKQTLQMPSRIMVLEFPRRVTLQNLRSSVRIETQITAKVKVDDIYWQTTITDLSINGCHLDIVNGEKLALANDKSINIVIENFKGLLNINLAATICNLKQQSQGLSFGVQFKAKSKKQVTNLLHHAVTIES